MLFLRIIIGKQISNIHVSFNKEIIFERYGKISLSNECAEVISTNLEKVLEGLSVFDLESVTTGTLFAYGQTCSGKTCTMMGEEHNEGVIPMAIGHLVKHGASKQDHAKVI